LTPSEYLATLERRGVSLWLNEEGTLRYRAPKGVVTASVAAHIRSNQDRLASLLRSWEPAALPNPFAEDPFADDLLGDDEPKPHVVLVRALLDEAQAGRLPVERVTLSDARACDCPTVIDTNALVLDTARLCRVADSEGRTEDAESHARDLLALVDWWNKRRTAYHNPGQHGLTYAQAEAKYGAQLRADLAALKARSNAN